jgi:hypothetical protein
MRPRTGILTRHRASIALNVPRALAPAHRRSEVGVSRPSSNCHWAHGPHRQSPTARHSPGPTSWLQPRHQLPCNLATVRCGCCPAFSLCCMLISLLFLATQVAVAGNLQSCVVTELSRVTRMHRCVQRRLLLVGRVVWKLTARATWDLDRI